jgi:hypothetical protein
LRLKKEKKILMAEMPCDIFEDIYLTVESRYEILFDIETKKNKDFGG